MPERPAQTPHPPQDEPWRDIHLEDIVRGAGALISAVSAVAAQINSAVNQSRTPAARPVNGAPALPVRGAAPGGRPPLVDLFDEGDEILLVVEWPDGDVAQLAANVQDDVLSLSLGDDAPMADLLLPAVVSPASLRQRARNGILQIRLRRAGAAGAAEAEAHGTV